MTSPAWSWLTREEYEDLRAACSAFHASVMRDGYWAQATSEAAGALGGAAERLLAVLWQRRGHGETTVVTWPGSTAVAEDVTLLLGGQPVPRPASAQVARCVEPGCGVEFMPIPGVTTAERCYFHAPARRRS